jgi:hypothetical protein
MTPEQVEAAARELCRLRGVDADAPYKTPADPFARHTAVEHFAAEVVEFAQVGTAIASVMVKPRRARKEKA